MKSKFDYLIYFSVVLKGIPMNKFLILPIMFFSCLSVNAQDYEATQRKLHRAFHDSFNTRDYLCTISNVSEIKFDIKTKKWSIDNAGQYNLGRNELIRIIKSDDISAPIINCNPRDEPQSYSSKDNKYFCLINTHPKSDSDIDKIFSKPDEVDSTHYKCLLDIRQNHGKDDVHTLICNSQFKFVLNYGKYFDNNFSIGPYSNILSNEKLSQRIETADCNKLNR